MAQLVKKRRPGWVLLVVSALVASLFAVPAAAIDDDSKPNAAATTSACVGDATNDRMFSDVSEMHAFRGDINCLAYYGVTIGYGDGTFGPNADVARHEMVLFMERAAGVAGADDEAVVGDFATTGSDPVNRGDMALLIARLLASATTDESARNVTIDDDDGTFAVGVTGDDLDYFADSRRSLNRISDSAVSALYELGVAKGTGMGYFSPASTVSRGAMAAFITRALAHTTARPEGVTIQSDEPGSVIVSVRDANFHPVANAAVDVFSVRADRVGEAFKADGSCNTPRLIGEGGNPKPCEIDPLDAVTGLSGDYDPGMINVNVKAGGTTVWAWTGDSGDKVEDGGEGLASINLTKTAPVTADRAKVTNDIAARVTRAAFGSTVTVTIQLVGDAGSDRADAVPGKDADSYEVVIRRSTDLNERTDATEAPAVTGGDQVSTQVLKVDKSGKATFEITASDPDTTDRNNPVGADASGDDPAVPDRIDRVTVTYTVSPADANAGPAVADNTEVTGSSATGTVRFSDAKSEVANAIVETATKYLMAPASGGSASNVVTVKVVDQYGQPVRNHLVRLSSNHNPDPTTDAGTDTSTFPVARRTDSSGTVRIGYTYKDTGSIETLRANTAADATATGALARIVADDGTADFYWASRPAAAGNVTAADIRVVDLDTNTVIIGGTATEAPSVLVYDDNDQFVIGTGNVTLAAFEEQLAKKDTGTADTVGVEGYDPTDSTVVARFTLTVNA
ncbi:S-layer homology domain-containing protein [Candidatus Spongiisocius sp.]|uniref:S-layer homology domain-containing protein n=1 Tax=Candidatus Spongiisocius sp. TaxID=3101273 RepID=UPI003B5B745F